MVGGLGRALRRHGPEYAIEAAGLCILLLAISGATAAIEHPESPLRAAVTGPLARQALRGVAIAATVVALVYSPWGKRSGAHFNPALTFTFWRLGKVEGVDALLYAAVHFAGAVAGVLVARALLGTLADELGFAATRPGRFGDLAAFATEAALSFGLMFAVLAATNAPRFARFTGLFAGVLLAAYVTLAAPLSGPSMNPARSFGPAAATGDFTSFWIYLTAPPLGMWLAAAAYVGWRGADRVRCAKLHHQNRQRCIFRCGYRPSS